MVSFPSMFDENLLRDAEEGKLIAQKTLLPCLAGTPWLLDGVSAARGFACFAFPASKEKPSCRQGEHRLLGISSDYMLVAWPRHF